MKGIGIKKITHNGCEKGKGKLKLLNTSPVIVGKGEKVYIFLCEKCNRIVTVGGK